MASGRRDRRLTQGQEVLIRLRRIETLLYQVLRMENFQMALGEDILNAVTEQTTVVDSFITLVQGLIDDNTIPAEVGAAILTKVNESKARVEAAILANTPTGG